MWTLIKTDEEYKQAEQRINNLLSKSVLQDGELSEVSHLTTLMAHYEQEVLLYDE